MMGIANKLAGALGSIIFGALLLSGIDEVNEQLSIVSSDEKAVLLDTMADSVFVPYIVMAIMLLLFGILIRKAPLPHVEAAPVEESEDGGDVKSLGDGGNGVTSRGGCPSSGRCAYGGGGSGNGNGGESGGVWVIGSDVW